MSHKGNRRGAQPQPSAKPAPQRPAQEPEEEKLSYDKRLAQMSVNERAEYKLANNASRIGNVLTTVKSWTVTDDAAKKQIEEVVDSLLEAQDGLRSACEALKALGSDFKPTRARRSSKVEAGSIVKVGKRDREAFAELMPGVDLDHLEVIATTGTKLRVKLSDGTTAFVARSQVSAVADDDPEEVAA